MAALCSAAVVAEAQTGSSTPPLRDGATGYTIACTLVADQPGIRSCTDLPTATACAREPDFASRSSAEATGMTFVNRSDRAIHIFWLDFHGNRVLYRTIPAGGRAVQQTFICHNWVVTMSDGQCVGVFRAAPESFAFF
jgi:hypothetical protein